MEWGLVVAGMLISTVCLGSGTTSPPPKAEAAVQAAPSKKASAPTKTKASVPKKTSGKKVSAKKTGGAPPVPKAPVEKEIVGRGTLSGSPCPPPRDVKVCRSKY